MLLKQKQKKPLPKSIYKPLYPFTADNSPPFFMESRCTRQNRHLPPQRVPMLHQAEWLPGFAAPIPTLPPRGKGFSCQAASILGSSSYVITGSTKRSVGGVFVVYAGNGYKKRRVMPAVFCVILFAQIKRFINSRLIRLPSARRSLFGSKRS